MDVVDRLTQHEMSQDWLSSQTINAHRCKLPW